MRDKPAPIETDYGVMAVTPYQATLPPDKLTIIARRRYLRGEDLSTLSHRRLPVKEMGGDDA